MPRLSSGLSRMSVQHSTYHSSLSATASVVGQKIFKLIELQNEKNNLKNKDNPLFSELALAFRDFMKKLKGKHEAFFSNTRLKERVLN